MNADIKELNKTKTKIRKHLFNEALAIVCKNTPFLQRGGKTYSPIITHQKWIEGNSLKQVGQL